MDERFERKVRGIMDRTREELANGQDQLTKRQTTGVQVSERLSTFGLYIIPSFRSAVAAAQTQFLKGVGHLDCGEAHDQRWTCVFTPSAKTLRKSYMLVVLNIDTGRVRVSMTLGRNYPTTEDLGAVGDIASAAIHAVVREFAIEAVHAA